MASACTARFGLRWQSGAAYRFRADGAHGKIPPVSRGRKRRGAPLVAVCKNPPQSPERGLSQTAALRQQNRVQIIPPALVLPPAASWDNSHSGLLTTVAHDCFFPPVLPERTRKAGCKPALRGATFGSLQPTNGCGGFDWPVCVATLKSLEFRLQPVPAAEPPEGGTMQLSGERTRLACGVRRPAEHHRSTNISPPDG